MLVNGIITTFQSGQPDSWIRFQYKFKYPKAGEDNSLIAVKIFDLDNLKTFDFDIGKNPDIYIPRMIWSKGNNELIVFKMNRLQNNLELLSGKFSHIKWAINSLGCHYLL